MRDLARLIDASANRAREALRVMEDLARFVLDDAGLSARLKDARHRLRSAIDAIDAAGPDRGVRLAHRDTAGDVGTAITGAGEGERASPADVAAAAGARAGEALRSLEEACKLAAPAAAPAFEALRYRVYDLERALGLALGPAGPGARRAPQWTLCVLLTEALCTHHPWERIAQLAIQGGADCLQLREKSLEGNELLARARRLVELTRAHAPAAARPAVIVNDRPDIALLAGADGVHVGQTDLPVREVRRLAGFRLLVGVSTANLDQARAAARDGANYCGCGPMFPTTTKDKPVLSGPGYLRDYLAEPATARLPHLAISGITPDNLHRLAEVGCRGVAVSGAVCGAGDPAAVCAALVRGMRAPGITRPGAGPAAPVDPAPAE